MKIYKCRYGCECACGTSDRLPNVRPFDARMPGQKYCSYIAGSDTNPGIPMNCGWAHDVGLGQDMENYILITEVKDNG